MISRTELAVDWHTTKLPMAPGQKPSLKTKRECDPKFQGTREIRRLRIQWDENCHQRINTCNKSDKSRTLKLEAVNAVDHCLAWRKSQGRIETVACVVRNTCLAPTQECSQPSFDESSHKCFWNLKHTLLSRALWVSTALPIFLMIDSKDFGPAVGLPLPQLFSFCV